MISLSDYYMGRDVKFALELTEEMQKNAATTIAKASEILSAFGEDRKVTSGWRPSAINKAQGGSVNSKHIYCQAIDLEDNDHKLGLWAIQNIERLKELGVYMESLTKTHNPPDGMGSWVHFQIVAPKSGKIIFMP